MDDLTHLSEAEPSPLLRRPRHWLWLWGALALGLAGCFAIDSPVLVSLHPLLGSPFNRFLTHTVRWLGNGYFQVPVLLGLVVIGALARWRPGLRAGAWGLLAFLVSGLACNILKVLFHRPRPWETVPPPDHWLGYAKLNAFHSFPSGDETTIMAIALVVSYFLPRTRVPLLIAAGLVAAERVILAAHHPSDVWAGAMLGLLTAQVLIARLRRRAEEPQP